MMSPYVVGGEFETVVDGGPEYVVVIIVLMRG
jgi:hypothetical protein